MKLNVTSSILIEDTYNINRYLIRPHISLSIILRQINIINKYNFSFKGKEIPVDKLVHNFRVDQFVNFHILLNLSGFNTGK